MRKLAVAKAVLVSRVRRTREEYLRSGPIGRKPEQELFSHACLLLEVFEFSLTRLRRIKVVACSNFLHARASSTHFSLSARSYENDVGNGCRCV